MSISLPAIIQCFQIILQIQQWQLWDQLRHGGVTGVNAGYFSSKGEVKENGTTHTNSTVSSNKIIGKEISALVNQCMFFCN